MTQGGVPRRVAAALAAGDLSTCRRLLGDVFDDRQARDEVLDLLAVEAAGGSALALDLLTELVDRTGLARKGVRRVLVNEDEVDDVSQDTLVSMARSIGSFSPERARFVTWLFHLAQRRATDHLRRAGRRRDAEERGADMGEAERISSLIATRADVRRLVRQLPEPYRAAVTLREVEQLPYEQVADRLGLNVNTAKSHVHRGRALMAPAVDRTTG